MKKIMIFGILALVLISIATASLFSSKEDAIARVRTLKSQISAIDNLSFTIQLATDKICEIDYISEDTKICYVKWNSTYAGERFESKVYLREGTTSEADNSFIKSEAEIYIKNQLKSRKQLEDMQYTERSIAGTILN